MPSIDFTTLQTACTPGGASVLTSRTELTPAAGDLAGIAPARFVEGRNGVYAFETRFDGSEPVDTVVIDSKGSSINRIEEAIANAINDDHPLLRLTPRVEVRYDGHPRASCLQLPHRAWDGHVRAGSIDGEPTTSNATYRAARDATYANAKALLEMSAGSLVFGSWDSTRKTHQARFRSCLVGEVVGVLADQSERGRAAPARGAARTDEIAPSVRLRAKDMESLLHAQEDELSETNIGKIKKAIDSAKKGTVSGAALGLGAIPPSMSGLGFVSCRSIMRHHVLTFSALRQLRFGLGAAGDVAARTLLAALALNGLARSDAELVLRANCDLREKGPTIVELDARHGDVVQLEPLTIDAADAVLEEAIAAARSAGVRWEGQVLKVVGNPLVAGGMSAADENDA